MSAHTRRIPYVPAQFKCAGCMTVMGCQDHRVFRCGSCFQPTWYCDGGGDDRANDCSSCWLAWFAPRLVIAAALASYLEGGS